MRWRYVGAAIEEPGTTEQITEEEFDIFTDNIFGANLPAEKVRAGRREEMGYTLPSQQSLNSSPPLINDYCCVKRHNYPLISDYSR